MLGPFFMCARPFCLRLDLFFYIKKIDIGKNISKIKV